MNSTPSSPPAHTVKPAAARKENDQVNQDTRTARSARQGRPGRSVSQERTGGEKTSEPRSNRFTEQELEIARETDLPDLLTSLGYTVTRVGRYHSTKEMDSLRIKNRRTWYRYSERVGGDAITFLQHFCGRSFPEAVEDLLAFHGRARDVPA